MAAKALIVLGLAACAAASGESYQRVWRVDGYDQVPTEYGVRVNGYNAYVDEDRVGRLGKRDASGESYQYVSRVDGYDQVPTEYGVRVNGYNAYVDEDRVGRLGKRSTYDYTPALAYHPAGGYGYNKYGSGTSYVYRSPQGLHKRSTYGYTPALAYHPAGGYGYNKYGSGTSYVYRSPQGLHKRDASGESYQYVSRVDGYDQVPTEYGVRVNGYNAYVDEDRVGRLGKRSTYDYTPALAYHPAGGYGYNKYGSGTSYVYRSPQGLHKREAEPSYAPALAYHPAGGYGYTKYGPGYSYESRSPQGLHKREASGASFQTVERSDCYGYHCQNSEYNVKVDGYNGDVDESRDGKNFAFQYGFNN